MSLYSDRASPEDSQRNSKEEEARTSNTENMEVLKQYCSFTREGQLKEIFKPFKTSLKKDNR